MLNVKSIEKAPEENFESRASINAFVTNLALMPASM